MTANNWLWTIGSLAILTGSAWANEPTPLGQRNAVPPSNQQVAQDIAGAIASAVAETGYAVEVEYNAGVATLRGTVSTEEQYSRIVAATQNNPAVNGVVCELTMREPRAVQSAVYQEGAPGAVQPEFVPAPEPLPASAPIQAPALAPPAPQHAFSRRAGLQYDWPYMPNFAWPADAPYPNYSAVQYPRSYRGHAWPYIGPFTPYPEPPLDWRKVTLRYKAGHWYLKFRQPTYLFRSIRQY